MPSILRLERILRSMGSVLVGYSGGVDSALVAVVARRALGPVRAVAALGISPSLAEGQYRQARSIAAAFDLEVLEIPTAELDDPQYVANRPDRCYFCKRQLWATLARVARARGLAVLADGTNADDGSQHRPGLQAAAEWGVRSPLAEAGFTKAAVRRAARALGLPNWNAPASPCLSSRILYGLSVTPERLRQVEAAEAWLRELGVEGDLRVRHRGEEARIEVSPAEFGRIRAAREPLAARFLALGFRRVTLDLAGYRRGSLLAGGGGRLEVLAEDA